MIFIRTRKKTAYPIRTIQKNDQTERFLVNYGIPLNLIDTFSGEYWSRFFCSDKTYSISYFVNKHSLWEFEKLEYATDTTPLYDGRFYYALTPLEYRKELCLLWAVNNMSVLKPQDLGFSLPEDLFQINP